MRIFAATLAALVALAIAACGSATSSGGGQAPSPTPPQITTPPPGFEVLVTERDVAVSAQAGQRLVVELRRRDGMLPWGPIRANDSSVLGPAAINFMAPEGVTVAAFTALRPGQTNVTSTSGPDCSPGQACPAYAMLFSVTVTVR